MTSFEAVAEIARRMKQERVAKYGLYKNEEKSDLANFCVCVRQGETIALVQSDMASTDSVRQIVYHSAVLMPVDEVFLVGDSRFMTGQEEDKERLAKLQQGELQERWQAGNREGITEGLMITRFPVLGPPEFRGYPYRRQGKKLTWGPVMDTGTLEGGAIPAAAARGFAKRKEFWPEFQKTLDLGAKLMSISEDRKQYHLDRVVGALLSEQTGVGAVMVFREPLVTFVKGKELVKVRARAPE